MKRLRILRFRVGLSLAMAAVSLCLLPPACAQAPADPFSRDPFHADSTRQPKDRPPSDVFLDKPTLPPAFTIPAEPLGFSAPGPIYLGMRNCLASLDFLDENHLLFTFRVPGLIRRQPGDADAEDERHIRAVVLALPDGAVQAEAVWPVHDRLRYLWMLKNGHFLVRDRDGLLEGDATLVLKPFLHFPGPLLSLELDPTQQLMMTNSSEPVASPAAQSGAAKPSNAATSGSDTADTDAQNAAGQPDLVVRILQRSSGQVVLVNRARSIGHLPFNAEGYIESLRGNGGQWLLNLNYFSGGTRVLGRVDSGCSPRFDFVSQQELLITVCAPAGADKLVAMSTDGRRLWDALTSDTSVWPLVVMAPDGSRLARETLATTHPVTSYSPLDRDDIKGQMVHVFDAADGKLELAAPASPPLDAGGNVAISPSGRRVAVINAGAIQVFELPAAPPLTSAAADQPAH